MIRLTCPNCGAKLRAKSKLGGKEKKCPRCGNALSVPEAGRRRPRGDDDEAAVERPPAEPHAEPPAEEPLPHPDLPERLNRQHHYLICGPSKLVATWENNGQGWMVETGHGLASAARNPDQLPSQGDFRLIEIQLETTDQGRRLSGIRSFQLAPRWALPSLARGDHEIMGKIKGPAGLDRDQKNVVRGLLREQFMPQVWQDSHEVREYLGNADYHSPGTV
jgi:hypothetical protein